MLVRPATAADAPALARIYNQGIEERTATFETTLRSEYDVLGWFDGVHPLVVVLDEPKHDVIAFARATEYRQRECYRGIFEFAVYTDLAHRRRGAALLAMRELITRAREAGAWKLLSRIFVENEGSRALMSNVGFREVGTYYRHAKLEGRWRDVVIVEKFLAPIGAIPSVPPPPGPLASAAQRGSRGDVLASLRDENADATALAQALDWARAIVDSFKRPDSDLLDAVADGFFLTKAHPAALRAQFVELFRAYAALSPEASREIYALLVTRLGRIPLASDLDAFYEALFVVKQIARGSDDAVQPHIDVLLGWMRAAVDVAPGLRGRISAGNVISLLMTLAAGASPNQEQRHALAEIAVIAKLRHRVDAPASLKGPPVGPPPSLATPSTPSTPSSPITPRRSGPPPLPHRRASQPDPEEVGEDDSIPLSSQDLLPESALQAIATPAIAFKPIALPPQAPVEPEPEPKPEPVTVPEPEPKPVPEPEPIAPPKAPSSQRLPVAVAAPSSERAPVSATSAEAKSKRTRRAKKDADPATDASASAAEPKKKATRSRKKPKPEE